MAKKINILLIVLFSVCLAVPTLVKVSGLDDYMNFENRVKKDFPSFDIRKIDAFINDFDGYYKENFGWRTLLFDCYGDFKYKILNESPLPEKVYVGKKGWLFLGNAFGECVKESLGILKFNEEELNNIKEKLIQNKKFLDSLNIRYYLVMPPDKQTIYSEYLPYTIKGQVSKLDQLTREIKNKTNIKLIDVRSALWNKKDSAQLYYKTDTHWNLLGAFIAYQEIMKVIGKDFPVVPILTWGDVVLTKKSSKNESLDLSFIMNQKIEDTIYVFTPVVKSKAEKVKSSLPIPAYFDGKPENFEFRFKNPSKPLKILIFRDSFSNFLSKYFNETFGESILIWHTDLNLEIILKEKPDLVIQEVIERNVDDLMGKKQ